MSSSSVPASLVEWVERGPHPVGVTTLELADPEQPGRPLPTDLWYPAAAVLRGRDQAGGELADHPLQRTHLALPDAAPAPDVFPLLAFSHGNSGLRRQSTFLTTHLASWGFLVVAPDHTGNTFFDMLGLDDEARRSAHFEARRSRPRDLAAAIDAALTGGPERPRADPARIGVLGHSFGGWTACKMPRIDPRVRAVCGLAPVSEPFVGRRAFESGELPFPRGVASLVVAGVEDVLVDLATSVVPLARRLDRPTRLVAVEGTDHFHFCDGVELLHGMHLANPRPNQKRPTKPLDELLPEPRIHRILGALVAGFFGAVLGRGDDPSVVPAEDEIAGLDRSLRVLS